MRIQNVLHQMHAFTLHAKLSSRVPSGALKNEEIDSKSMMAMARRVGEVERERKEQERLEYLYRYDIRKQIITVRRTEVRRKIEN